MLADDNDRAKLLDILDSFTNRSALPLPPELGKACRDKVENLSLLAILIEFEPAECFFLSAAVFERIDNLIRLTQEDIKLQYDADMLLEIADLLDLYTSLGVLSKTSNSDDSNKKPKPSLKNLFRRKKR